MDANGKLITPSSADGPVLTLTAQHDGSIIAGGSFNHILGVERKNLARLKTPTTLDLAFTTGKGFNGTVRSLVTLPDGGLLVGGDFNRVDGQVRRGLARLNRNGSLNADLDARLNGAGKVNGIVLRANGAVVVAGDLAPPGVTNDSKMAQIFGASPAPGNVLASKTLTTAANSVWLDTGFDILKDSTYEILATGIIKLSDGTDLLPDGLLQQPYAADIGPQGKPGHDPAHPARSLIAQIGDSKLTMFIGSHQRFIAPATGRLKLRCNINPGEQLKSQGQFDVSIRKLESMFMTEPDWRFELATKIDTSDELHLRFGTAQWVHKGGGSVAGRHGGLNLPTILNGFCWWPEWDGNTSQPVRAPGLLYPYSRFGLKVWKVLDGRGTCAVVRQTYGKGQNGGPDYVVLDFDDGGAGAVPARSRWARPLGAPISKSARCFPPSVGLSVQPALADLEVGAPFTPLAAPVATSSSRARSSRDRAQGLRAWRGWR